MVKDLRPRFAVLREKHLQHTIAPPWHSAVVFCMSAEFEQYARVRSEVSPNRPFNYRLI